MNLGIIYLDSIFAQRVRYSDERVMSETPPNV